jgi:hypothetical protein
MAITAPEPKPCSKCGDPIHYKPADKDQPTQFELDHKGHRCRPAKTPTKHKDHVIRRT